MKVMKFTGSTMQQVMAQIRSELGPDAVILNSKTVQSAGYFGLFKKKSLEVLAAIDEDVPVAEKKPPRGNSGKKENSVEADRILKELKQMQGLLEDNLSSHQIPGKFEWYPKELKSIYLRLQKLGLSIELLDEMMDMLLKEWKRSFAITEWTEEDLEKLAKRWMMERVSAFSIPHDEPNRKYMAIVGPTGVGKTTTIAKIATEYMLKKQRKVAFITTDTYRIAAIEQLRTYAQILGIPMEVAYNLEDFIQASKRFAHYDHVFIDTAGRNFRDSVYVEELMKIMDIDLNLHTFLVLAATAKEEDMTKIYKQFDLMNIDGLIFTKTDETESLGGMINFIMNHSVPVAYITNGQDVPDDIQAATPENIINMVFGGREHVRSS